MKNLFLTLLLSLVAANVSAQTTATDWTKTDCNTGASHHLFAELEEGYVIVQEYVMMNCNPCVTGGNGLKSLVAAFEATHPGKVRIYQTSFNNTTTCATMNNWASTNNFSASTIFTNGATEVSYYGGMGMPTIVVMGGGAEHRVFYVEQGYSPSHNAAITQAIQDAIDASNVIGIGNAPEKIALSINPNPTNEFLNIETAQTAENILVLSSNGQTMLQQQPNAAKVSMDISHLPTGLYFVQVSGKDGSSAVGRFVKE